MLTGSRSNTDPKEDQAQAEEGQDGDLEVLQGRLGRQD